jgi:hypothetical protein
MNYLAYSFLGKNKLFNGSANSLLNEDKIGGAA